MKPISFDALVQAHDLTIKRHGGLPGIRDEGAIRGAIDRPVNIALYEDNVTAGRLAAAVCVGVAKAHGFTDGNKRAALFALAMQLRILGYTLDASQKDTRDAIWSVADGQMGEVELADWVNAHLLPAGD
ncbi:type II toxin-antitoxin system death-on-curing family toxin [Ensifer adhaerens]|uniref:type II toxin-antitoxin system death-on-curing family toxin n=1 Tax=Ensifer adhaerens TaxID=106592 RepID=UPI00098F1BAF|nr:type II toxin-antitoxin system death-on-curing family toxin [Ensifer adhaerens]